MLLRTKTRTLWTKKTKEETINYLSLTGHSSRIVLEEMGSNFLISVMKTKKKTLWTKTVKEQTSSILVMEDFLLTDLTIRIMVRKMGSKPLITSSFQIVTEAK